MRRDPSSISSREANSVTDSSVSNLRPPSHRWPWRVWVARLVALSFSTTLLLHAYLGTFSRFIADDYCSAAAARRLGILRAAWYWYLNWTGRYAASALDAAFGVLGPGITPVVPSIVLIIWLVVLTLAARRFDVRPGGRLLLGSFTTAAGALYLTLQLTPSVAQSLYWGQGMRSVVPPLILGVLYVDLLARLHTRDSHRAPQPLWLALSFAFTFIMGGFNETFTAIEVSLLVLAVLRVLMLHLATTHRAKLSALMTGALGASLAFIVVVIAPGNAFRQAFYPPPPPLLQVLRIAYVNFTAFLVSTFDTVPGLLAVVSVVAVSLWFGMHLPTPRPSIWLAPAILGGATAVAFLCFLPAAYGLSDAPPDRTLIIPTHLLSVALIAAGLTGGRYLGAKHGPASNRSVAELVIIGIALMTVLTSIAISDHGLLTQRASFADYASYWDRMNSQAIAARRAGQTQLQIQQEANWAGLDEPNDNPKFWLNICLREYYGIEVLALTPP